jgi:cyanophycinase
VSKRRGAGALVIVGGAEDKEGDSLILQEFVALAGGAKADIAVMTVATQYPKEVGAEYVALFERLGAGRAQAVSIRNRDDANDLQRVREFEGATGIYFTGGNQVRIISMIGGTETDACLHQRHSVGVVLGGTSAGASVMSSVMIVEGQSETNPQVRLVEKAPGLGFIDGVFIDQHFAQRGRIGRLLTAVAQQPAYLGVGIDEDTAIIVTDGQFRVIGSSAVTVIDASHMTYTNLRGLDQEKDLALYGVQLHNLPAGYCFDLRHRTPIIPADDETERREE